MRAWQEGRKNEIKEVHDRKVGRKGGQEGKEGAEGCKGGGHGWGRTRGSKLADIGKV